MSTAASLPLSSSTSLSSRLLSTIDRVLMAYAEFARRSVEVPYI